jgi:RNA-directed DNA polymerase
MAAIEERVVDRHALKLLRAMLRAGVMQDGTVRRSDTGTPQGGVLSPVLCNVYLHRLDRQWTERGTGVLVRYADDRVPRTLKEDRCRRRYRRKRCCTRDEGAGPLAWWPFAAALQGEAANHREVRRSRAGVLSVADKARL